MELDDLLRSPWFYRSPGPLSLVYYFVVVSLGAHVLLSRVKYEKWPMLNAFSESFFVNGFIVLTGDFLWMLGSALRFLPEFPDSLVQVLAVLGRDLVGCLFCFLLVGNRFLDGTVGFKRKTFLAYVLLILFFVAVFGVAESPAFTDWTYAVRVGASTEAILTSLVVCYGVGKALGSLVIWTWWKS